MAVTIVQADAKSNFDDLMRQDYLLAKDSSGRYWYTLSNNSNTVVFYYSDDDGDTWSTATGTLTTGQVNNSLAFNVDSDGNIHVVYVDSGTVRFRMGTVSGSTITWKTAVNMPSNSPVYHSVTAFPFGTGWKAFVAQEWSGQKLVEITISATHVPTVTTTHTLSATGSNGIAPKVDLRHTGDGLTVDSPADVFVAYGKSTGGMFFRKFSESGGSWTMGAERTIHASAGFSSAAYDGTNEEFMMCNGNGTTPTVWGRTADDSTTTDYLNPSALSGGTWYDLTVDQGGSVYLLGSNGTDDPSYVKWDRSTTTWGSWTVIETTTDSSPLLGPTWSGGTKALARGAAWVNDGTTPDTHFFDEVLVFTANLGVTMVFRSVEN